jgi:molybdopterin synthase sulfur carrier subunit
VRIEVLYFARLRETVGTGAEVLEVDEGDTVDRVVSRLRARQEWQAVASLPLSFAVNEVVVSGDRVLRDGDVVALLPPVSGG